MSNQDKDLYLMVGEILQSTKNLNARQDRMHQDIREIKTKHEQEIENIYKKIRPLQDFRLKTITFASAFGFIASFVITKSSTVIKWIQGSIN